MNALAFLLNAVLALCSGFWMQQIISQVNPNPQKKFRLQDLFVILLGIFIGVLNTLIYPLEQAFLGTLASGGFVTLGFAVSYHLRTRQNEAAFFENLQVWADLEHMRQTLIELSQVLVLVIASILLLAFTQPEYELLFKVALLVGLWTTYLFGASWLFYTAKAKKKNSPTVGGMT